MVRCASFFFLFLFQFHWESLLTRRLVFTSCTFLAMERNECFGVSVIPMGNTLGWLTCSQGLDISPSLWLSVDKRVMYSIEKNPVSWVNLHGNVSLSGVEDHVATICGNNREVGKGGPRVHGIHSTRREFIPRADFLKKEGGVIRC